MRELRTSGRGGQLAYVPKPLVLGRCARCGKKLYRGDVYYYCPECDVYYCDICTRKLFNKCGICQKELLMM